MKNWLFNTFVAERIAKLFSGLKGYKTQVGIAVVVLLTAAKFFAPIPADYIPMIDKMIDIVIGATGIALGDKIRRNYEIAKSMADSVMDKVVTKP